MGDAHEVEQLREKIAALEVENQELLTATASASVAAASSERSKLRLRSAAALILVLITALLAPVAVLGSWVRAELVDTDQFVQTLAPLAHKPEMQAFVAAEVSAGIKQSVDIDGMVSDLVAGLAATNLPPSAQAALPLLEGTAASGVRSLIDSGVTTVVESPQFASVWETALRETHARSTAIIQGDPNAVLQLDEDGTLALDLRAITSHVRGGMVSQGIGFAEHIPEIDRRIPLVTSDSFVLVRTVYQLAAQIGLWLPWVTFALLTAGVLVSRNRLSTLARAGLAIAASLLLALIGLNVAKMYFIGSVSPSIMPAPAAEVLFVQLTELIASTLVALIVLFLAVSIGGWLAGSAKRAVAVRNAFSGGFAAVRRSADDRGIGTGAIGSYVDRWYSVILVVAVLAAVSTLFFMRPITGSGVVAVVLSLLGVLLVVELVRRPVVPVQAEVREATEAASPS